ncbi:MAG: hypothetical protein E5Y73_33875 [Mesorhizobium sp.]|uniref:restriction endonuclease subunit S n=1 Tax=Mesorhizobium sp. TaxID=1871066 RepID=UPI0011F6CCAE|nr:restriction endonuclease subunit S [Mesorhizobium sp.]TIL84348.1 MAG: hypothetical protein E5Y73_33875 [Mesorhizobium sp.]
MSGLPKGWAEANLMEIIELHDSVRVPLNKSERSAKPGPYPYYGANGLVDHIDEYLFDGEFVLLAEDGGNFDVPGKPVAYRVDGKFWVNNHAHIMKPRASIPASFLLHWCNNWNWMPFVGGTTRLKLTQEGMRKVRLALPPLAEQKRLVAKLDALNAKSARARTELARIETLVSRYKEAVLSMAFSGELTREWRGDAEWPHPVRLGDVAGSFAYGSAAKSRKTGSVPVLRMGNIQGGRLDWSDLVYTDDRNEIEKYRLSPEDVLFNRTNSPALVGKTALYGGEREAIFAGY